MGMIIVLLVLIIVTVAIIMIRNNIVRHHNASIRAWSDVATYERQKIKVLDDLAPLVEQYSSFEKGTLEKVTELRQNILNLNLNTSDVSQLQRVESLSKELMRNLNVVVENYPELKANELYLKMMSELKNKMTMFLLLLPSSIEMLSCSIIIFKFSQTILLTLQHLGKRSFAHLEIIKLLKVSIIVQIFNKPHLFQ